MFANPPVTVLMVLVCQVYHSPIYQSFCINPVTRFFLFFCTESECRTIYSLSSAVMKNIEARWRAIRLCGAPLFEYVDILMGIRIPRYYCGWQAMRPPFKDKTIFFILPKESFPTCRIHTCLNICNRCQQFHQAFVACNSKRNTFIA